MTEDKKFYDFICAAHGGSEYDALRLTNSSFQQLMREIGNTANRYSLMLDINGKNIYVISGAQSDHFYKCGSLREKLPLYPAMETPNLKPATQHLEGVSLEVMDRKFTNGQMLLLHTLNLRMSQKQPFTIDDARIIFCKVMKPGPQRIVRKNADSTGWEHVTAANGLEVLKDKPGCYDQQMKQWLKNNFGALMLKGALIAIPVIQLGEDALMDVD